MKIMIGYSSAYAADDSGWNTMVFPDSSMVRSGKPVFIPEIPLYLFPGFAARIHSVGKSIREKFASRYYDEVMPIGLVATSETASLLHDRKDPLACDIISDYSLICGESLDETAEETCLRLALIPLKDEESSGTYDLSIPEIHPHEEIDRVIEAASRTNTLKTGDMVGFIVSDNVSIRPDTLLKVEVNGNLLIENKFK